MPKEPSTKNSVEYKASIFLQENELIDLLIANAPFLSQTNLSNLLGISVIVLNAVAKHLNIKLLESYDDGHAPQIVERLGYLPVDSIIKPWLRGIKVICSTNEAGYLCIIHHFAENSFNPEYRSKI